MRFDFSGIGVTLAGLPAELEARVGSAFGGWADAAARAPAALSAEVETVVRPYAESEFRPKAMRSALGPQRARFELPEGDVEVGIDGRARLRLVAATGERGYWALLNLLRAALAWVLPSRGGCALHAAALVVEGRAFVLVGAEGAGKTTWARLGQDAGALAVSDDFVLLDGAAHGATLAGAPFRSTLGGPAPRGRWPVAALLHPAHGSPAALAPVGRLAARARLLANLPFVAEGVERDARIGALLERLSGEVPNAELRFGLDGAFLDTLAAWTPR